MPDSWQALHPGDEAGTGDSMRLYDQICAIRLTAAVIYDTGIASGMTQEAAGGALQPLKDQMKHLLHEAAKHDLPGVVFAVRALESEAWKHDRDIKFLQEKRQDTHEISKMIESALIKDLKHHKSTERIQGDSMATLIDERLTLR